MKIKEAVILLGGMGTRLLPYTKSVPKEMLPIYNTPAIFLLVKEAYLSGIKKIIFVVTKHNKKMIENFFSDDNYLNNFLKDKPEKQKLLNELNDIIKKMQFKYIYQNIKGTYGALYSARKYIKEDNFIVMYGDDLIDGNEPVTKLLINEFNKTGNMQVAVKEKDYNELPKVGVVKLDNNDNIINLVPIKEDHSNCEIHGRMLLNKKIFNVLNDLYKHDNDEYYLPYALLKFNEVHAYKYDGEYFNLGNTTGYIKASIHYALKNNKDNNDLLKYIERIK